MAISLRHQPYKALYTTFEFVGTVLVKVPFWLLLSIPRSWRPRPSWSMKDSFLIQLLRHLVSVRAKTMSKAASGYPARQLGALGEGVYCVWVTPIPKLVVGDLAVWSRTASVSSIHVQGYWYCKSVNTTIPKRALPGEKVLYSLHGGAYTYDTAHPSGLNAKVIRHLLNLDCSINCAFAIDYRLSSESSNPFPAALVDALAGYYHLVHTIGFNPSNIIIEGSAGGGNLALALTRYLIDYYGHSEAADLPDVPGSLILLSPWADIGLAPVKARLEPATINNTRSWLVSDYMFGPQCPMTSYSQHVFLGPHGTDVAAINEYISPSSRHPLLDLDFEDFPRTFISAGAAENLLPQIRLLKDRMVRDLGHDDKGSEKRGKVTYHEAPDASHHCLALPFAIQKDAQRELLAAISEWLVGSRRYADLM
ncbi:Alpha/Beta hydrolase protein [Lentinula edodes]|uniref:Alpha/Beta hydrolase protein n=1 Tax=Lentinula edodes TaxID=5353 RepID=UPI001E8DD6DF|nr:Alpha/Beta hydrolase protein [Lentinula edodes]KAH7874720.1 Alpha/Beta hydrolase protein [Lentinula edodes]